MLKFFPGVTSWQTAEKFASVSFKEKQQNRVAMPIPASFHVSVIVMMCNGKPCAHSYFLPQKGIIPILRSSLGL